MYQEWIFGIDGGGTSTRLRVENRAGELLYRTKGSSLNPRSVGWSGARKTLNALFSTLYERSDVGPSGCLSGFVGAAGVDRKLDTETMRNLVREAGSLSSDIPVEVKNDSIPALAGAFGELKGILLMAGTGSIAVGADGSGRIVRSSGWGHILGDEGSAYWVGLRALNAAVRFHDQRGPQTGLLDRALTYFDVSDPFLLIPAIYGKFDKARIAGFASIVAEERDTGDEVAKQIFEDAARELALNVISIASRLDQLSASGAVAFSGGFLSHNEGLWHATEMLTRAALPNHHVISPIADSVTGACLLARKNISAMK